jgi:hypothetical protein
MIKEKPKGRETTEEIQGRIRWEIVPDLITGGVRSG